MFISYDVEMFDNENVVLMTAENFEVAYDAIMYAFEEHEVMHDLIPNDSLFHVRKTVVWERHNGKRYRLMCQFG